MITIIKNALKGVDHSRKVYRAKNKKYPLALLYDNRFKDRMSQAVKQFVIDKKEQERVEFLKEQVNPKLRDRNTPPSKVIMHLGPTNSGKTKYAIEEMVKQYKDNDNSIIAYGGPLRMLALEVYHKLCDELGESNVGLITGEQEINPQARIVACTIECVPDHGDVLIVDEYHGDVLIVDECGTAVNKKINKARNTYVIIINNTINYNTGDNTWQSEYHKQHTF